MTTLPRTTASIPDLSLDLQRLKSSLVQQGAIQTIDHWRVLHIEEINANQAHADRKALANVFASIPPDEPMALLYLIEGCENQVRLYFGVVAQGSGGGFDPHEAEKVLRSALIGHLPGIRCAQDTPATRRYIIEAWNRSPYCGLMLGVPSIPQDKEDEGDFQGIDRLARGMMAVEGGGAWRVAILSQRLALNEVQARHDQALQLASKLGLYVATQVQASSNESNQRSYSVNVSQTSGSNDSRAETRGKNESGSVTHTRGSSSGSSSSSSSQSKAESKSHGTSESVTITKGASSSTTHGESASRSTTVGSNFGFSKSIEDKKIKSYLEHLQEQILPRLKKGLAQGLFKTQVLFAAANPSQYRRLKQLLSATFQGREGTLTPLQTLDLNPERRPIYPLRFITSTHALSDYEQQLLSLSADANHEVGTLLTAEELAVLAGLPQRELPGIRRHDAVEFILDLPTVSDGIVLGEMIDHGRICSQNPVTLSRSDLNKHLFVTGVTGAGKTTTCRRLLIEWGKPFLVIEPAKTEYRSLIAHFPDLTLYRPQTDGYHSLRINPFALVRRGQKIRSHVGFLKNVFTAIFPLEASMPMMIEAAMLDAYEAKGWDIDATEWLGPDPEADPFDPRQRAWPTLSDMLVSLDRLLPTYGLGKEFEEKYRGSLISRLRSLTEGTLGPILDVPQSLDWDLLLDQHVVIELEELQGAEEKAVVMALLLGGINEALRARHDADRTFRHLTLVEEAHRLLARPEPGNPHAALAVESFANMLAEVRKYGEGLIIADQIPAKLIPDVIKNTHIKIVHRLYAEDDRRTMGEAMMMNDEQRGHLPRLGTGEAVVYCGGWHGPALAKISNTHTAADEWSLPNEQLETRFLRQFAAQRRRFAPEYSALPIFAGDDTTTWAELLRATRSAINHLLHLCQPLISKGQARFDARQQNRVAHLHRWYHTWQQKLGARQPDYDAWRCQQPQPDQWPQQLLAAVWMAVLLDANPLPRAEVKNPASLYLPPGESNRALRAQATDTLIALIASSPQASDLACQYGALPPDEQRVLQHHLEHLAQFKRI